MKSPLNTTSSTPVIRTCILEVYFLIGVSFFIYPIIVFRKTFIIQSKNSFHIPRRFKSTFDLKSTNLFAIGDGKTLILSVFPLVPGGFSKDLNWRMNTIRNL